MPRLQAQIDIQRPPREVFDITNDIDRWNVLFNEYSHCEIVKREEAGRFTRIVFKLRNKEGQEWTSWRILDHQDLVAIAERQTPLFPFKYMHLKWEYEPVDGGTRMTWTQDFEMDPKLGVPESKLVEFLERHGDENQARMKELLESGAVTASAPA